MFKFFFLPVISTAAIFFYCHFDRSAAEWRNLLFLFHVFPSYFKNNSIFALDLEPNLNFCLRFRTEPKSTVKLVRWE